MKTKIKSECVCGYAICRCVGDVKQAGEKGYELGFKEGVQVERVKILLLLRLKYECINSYDDSFFRRESDKICLDNDKCCTRCAEYFFLKQQLWRVE